jgi:hypothetical protein
MSLPAEVPQTSPSLETERGSFHASRRQDTVPLGQLLVDEKQNSARNWLCHGDGRVNRIRLQASGATTYCRTSLFTYPETTKRHGVASITRRDVSNGISCVTTSCVKFAHLQSRQCRKRVIGPSRFPDVIYAWYQCDFRSLMNR